MKKYVVIPLMGLVLLLSACNKSQPAGKVYNPSTMKSSLSAESKQLAIAKKRAEANGLLDSTNYYHAVKLNIMVPGPDENFPEEAALSLASRLLRATAANGIAGYGGNPAFALVAFVSPIQSGVTNTAPEKRYTKYNINLSVLNAISGDVFGSSVQEVMGVGASDELACINAMQAVATNNSLQAMLHTSSSKIISWYESHVSSLQTQVNNYMRLGEYDKAYALMSSIPQEATQCFAYAQKNIDEVQEKYFIQLSSEYYHRLLSAIAADDETYNPETGALMAMIPTNAPDYEDAHNAYAEYVSGIAEIASARRAHEMFLEEESLAIEKLRVESEMKANEALLTQAQAEVAANSPENKRTEMVGNSIVSIATFGIEKLIGLLFL